MANPASIIGGLWSLLWQSAEDQLPLKTKVQVASEERDKQLEAAIKDTSLMGGFLAKMVVDRDAAYQMVLDTEGDMEDELREAASAQARGNTDSEEEHNAAANRLAEEAALFRRELADIDTKLERATRNYQLAKDAVADINRKREAQRRRGDRLIADDAFNDLQRMSLDLQKSVSGLSATSLPASAMLERAAEGVAQESRQLAAEADVLNTVWEGHRRERIREGARISSAAKELVAGKRAELGYAPTPAALPEGQPATPALEQPSAERQQ